MSDPDITRKYLKDLGWVSLVSKLVTEMPKEHIDLLIKSCETGEEVLIKGEVFAATMNIFQTLFDEEYIILKKTDKDILSEFGD